MSTATDPPELLEVGRIVRVHGLRGELVVHLTSNVDKRLAKGVVLYTSLDGASSLHILSARPHQDRWLIVVDGVNTREAAEAVGRPRLYAEPIDDPDAVWVHRLFGQRVVDSDGIERGIVVEVLDNPASELLSLDTGRLVPLDFVTDISDGVIHVDVPDGLWDI